jgi:AraC family transcriptional regulator
MFEVQHVELAEQTVLSMRFEVRPQEFGPRLATVFPAIAAFARDHGLSIASQPFSRYHGHDDERGVFDIEAGIVIEGAAAGGSIEGVGDVVVNRLPSGPAVTLMHVGPYEDLGHSHDALSAWLESEGVEPNGGPWEIYITDPGEVEDPSGWQTQLVQPTKS